MSCQELADANWWRGPAPFRHRRAWQSRRLPTRGYRHLRSLHRLVISGVGVPTLAVVFSPGPARHDRRTGQGAIRSTPTDSLDATTRHGGRLRWRGFLRHLAAMDAATEVHRRAPSERRLNQVDRFRASLATCPAGRGAPRPCPILGAEWERRVAGRRGQKGSQYPSGHR